MTKTQLTGPNLARYDSTTMCDGDATGQVFLSFLFFNSLSLPLSVEGGVGI